MDAPTTDGYGRLDPTAAFAEMLGFRLADESLETVLDRIAMLARRSTPGADEVSVTLIRGDRASTAAFTGQRGLELDETQYEEREGPCLEAAMSGQTQQITDMQTETRWPRFVEDATAHGIRSSLSTSLPVQQDILGALNMYASVRAAFDDDAVTMAQTFAGYAAVAIANARLYESTTALNEQMHEAMQSSAVIEQAKGILIARHGISAEDAFAILSAQSQNSNTKVRDLAKALVDEASSTRHASDS